MTENYKDYRLKGTLHAPFSPILMEYQIPQHQLLKNGMLHLVVQMDMV